MHAQAVSGEHYMYVDHQAVDVWNRMQSLHCLSHWEMLVYSFCYYSFTVFSWECWSTLLLNTSNIIPIVKIILMLTFHIITNLVQLLLSKPQINTLSSTLTLALIWPQNSKAKPISCSNSLITTFCQHTFNSWEILKTPKQKINSGFYVRLWLLISE